MSGRLEILNRLIDIEDEFQSRLDEELKKQVQAKIIEEFGDDGLKVAQTYYKNDNNLSKVNIDDCPECSEKAKMLVEQMNIANQISQSMASIEFLNAYFKFNDKLKSRIKKRIVWIIKTTVKYLTVNNIVFNKDLLRNLVLALIMEYFNQETSND